MSATSFAKQWSSKYQNNSRVDILKELWLINLDHVIEEIFHMLDSTSLQSCEQVSLTWRMLARQIQSPPKRLSSTVLEDDIVSMDANKEYVAIGLQSGLFLLYDRLSKTCNLEVKAHSDPVTAVTLNGELCLTGSTRGAVRVWRINTGDMVASLPCHRDSVTSLRSFPSRSISLSSSLDGSINIIYLSTRNSRFSTVLIPSSGELLCLDVALNVSRFVVGGESGFWSAALKRDLNFVAFPIDSCVRCCSISDNASLAAAASMTDCQIKVFSVESQQCKYVLNDCGAAFVTALYFVHGTLLATICNRLLKRWTLAGATVVGQDVFLLPDLPNLLMADNNTCLISAASGKELWHLDFWHGDGGSTRLTMEINENFCRCGFDFPRGRNVAEHLLMTCPYFAVSRQRMFKAIACQVRVNFQGLSQLEVFEMLLYGSERLHVRARVGIQTAVQDFINIVNTPVD